MIYYCLKNDLSIIFKDFTLSISLPKVYIFLISLFNNPFSHFPYFPYFPYFLHFPYFFHFFDCLLLASLHYSLRFTHISYTTLVTHFHRFDHFLHFPYTFPRLPCLHSLPHILNFPHLTHILHNPINFLYFHKV
jgi:hypothetical protein